MSAGLLIAIVGGGVVLVFAVGLLLVKAAEARGRAAAEAEAGRRALDQAQKVIDVQNRAAPVDADVDRWLRQRRGAG